MKHNNNTNNRTQRTSRSVWSEAWVSGASLSVSFLGGLWADLIVRRLLRPNLILLDRNVGTTEPFIHLVLEPVE